MNSDDKNGLMESLMFLKALKVPGEMKSTVVSLRGTPEEVKFQHIDASFMEQIKSLVGETSFRIKRRGGVYTQDIRMNRLNFVVDDEFNLKDIYWG